MPTDDDLSTLLRRGFAQATADLDPAPDLVHVVRRRHFSARRRRRIVAVAVPAAALAAGTGFALAGRNIPNHTAVAVPPPSAPTTSVAAPRTTQVTSVPMKPASYKMVLKDHGAPAPAGERDGSGRQVGESGRVLVLDRERSMRLHRRQLGRHQAPERRPGPDRRLPRPLRHARNGCARSTPPVAPGTNDFHPRGGWVVLTVSANAPRELVVRLILVPAN
jgi:hypothetical protein